MSYAVCCVPVAPIRSEQGHKAEMVSQLLFGECCIITYADKTGWCKVVNKHDAYTGWCQRSHLQEIAEEDYSLSQDALAADWINEVEVNGSAMMIPFGSSLTTLKNTFHYRGQVWNINDARPDTKTIKKIAFTFLNTAYLWGGRSVFGTDCSGFTQMVYKFLNIPLHRDAQQQAMQGEIVGFIQQAHCGDLAFFDNDEGNIIHVGLLLNEHEIIHSAGKVHIDKIDNQGIVNMETGERTQRLRIIKRYF